MPEKRYKYYLSIVVTARNDDHGGNFLDRVQLFVDNLCLQSAKYILDAEIIIVEWNPPEDRKKLSQAIRWPASGHPLSFRFITVPADLHNRLQNADVMKLFQYHGKNAGLKRALGQFVLCTNIDILFSNELVWFLSRKLLSEDCFYRVTRYDVQQPDWGSFQSYAPENILKHCKESIVRCHSLHGSQEISPDDPRYKNSHQENLFFKTSEPELLEIAQHKTMDKLFTNACGDFTLMSYAKWLEIKGYPEIPKGDLYIDGLVIHMACVNGLNQIVMPEPMRVYHIDHDMSYSTHEKRKIARPSLDYRKEYLPMCEQMLKNKKILDLNPQNWGFSDQILEEVEIVSDNEQRGCNG